jgi:hypothetical protein
VHSNASGPRNIDALYLMLRWARYGFERKSARLCHAKLVFLHPVRSAGHVLHFGASGPRNIIALFSWSGGPSAVFINSAPGHVTPNLSFFIRSDLRVT